MSVSFATKIEDTESVNITLHYLILACIIHQFTNIMKAIKLSDNCHAIQDLSEVHMIIKCSLHMFSIHVLQKILKYSLLQMNLVSEIFPHLCNDSF